MRSKRSEDPAEDNGRQSSEKANSTRQQFFRGELSSSRRSLPEGGGGGATHSIPKEPEDMLAQPRRVCSSRGSEARLAAKDPDVGSKEFDIRDEYKGQDDDSSDGPISPLQGGSEDRYLPYLPTLPSVFGRGGKELAARDLDVETGVSEERGRLPGIGDAQEGQGDGDRAAIPSGGAEAGSAAEDADESTEKSAMSATQRRHRRRYKAKAMARGEDWRGGS